MSTQKNALPLFHPKSSASILKTKIKNKISQNYFPHILPEKRRMDTFHSTQKEITFQIHTGRYFLITGSLPSLPPALSAPCPLCSLPSLFPSLSAPCPPAPVLHLDISLKHEQIRVALEDSGICKVEKTSINEL